MSNVNSKVGSLLTFGGRLRAERSRLSLNQTEFGEACGVTKFSQVNYEGDKRSPDSAYLAAAADIGADVLYILTGVRSNLSQPDVIVPNSQKSANVDQAFSNVPLMDVRLAAGSGAVNGDETIASYLAFRKDWLRRVGITSASAVVARASGDSMTPTINDGDLVLIDRAKNDPPNKPRSPEDKRKPAVFALLDGECCRLKRIELAAPGLLALISDNPEHPTEYRPAKDVQIIGRVLWWAHTDRD